MVKKKKQSCNFEEKECIFWVLSCSLGGTMVKGDERVSDSSPTKWDSEPVVELGF